MSTQMQSEILHKEECLGMITDPYHCGVVIRNTGNPLAHKITILGELIVRRGDVFMSEDGSSFDEDPISNACTCFTNLERILCCGNSYHHSLKLAKYGMYRNRIIYGDIIEDDRGYIVFNNPIYFLREKFRRVGFYDKGVFANIISFLKPSHKQVRQFTRLELGNETYWDKLYFREDTDDEEDEDEDEEEEQEEEEEEQEDEE